MCKSGAARLSASSFLQLVRGNKECQAAKLQPSYWWQRGDAFKATSIFCRPHEFL